MQASTLEKSILHKPMRIDFHRSLLDTALCQTFTEVIVTDKAHPYVLGVRQRVVLGQVSEVDALVTDQGDWLFNADNYLKFSTMPSSCHGARPATGSKEASAPAGALRKTAALAASRAA